MLSVTRPVALATALTSALLLAGCGGSADGAGNGRSAVAAFYPLAWVTGRVAGDEWTVENLTSPGTEPHDLSLDITQTAAVARADLVVLEHDFQPAVDETVEKADDAGRRRRRGVDLVPALTSTSTSTRTRRGGAPTTATSTRTSGRTRS